MSGPIIIDRRLNPKSKSLVNRQRFLDRVKNKIKDAAKKKLGDRNIDDQSGENVNVSSDEISEPHFKHDSEKGVWDYVLPGNKEYSPGDTIARPKAGGGDRGSKGSPDGNGEDDFSFNISYDEYLDIIFDDLELKNLVKQNSKQAVVFKNKRSGYATEGVPNNLNIERTAISALGRRIALAAPKTKAIALLEEELLECDDAVRRQEIINEIFDLKRRRRAVQWLDKVDLRYNNYVKQPKPITQAVMFCVMDVSFSMGESEKIIAKKFFILLYLFLNRKYKHIELVFIRHHSEAEECDQEKFFTSKESGGTVVSTAYEVMNTALKRYDNNVWNIYMAQVSDGDNDNSDSNKVKELLSKILPLLQHAIYLEVSQPYELFSYMSVKVLWKTLSEIINANPNLTMKNIHTEAEIIGKFREIFAKEKK